MKSFLKELHLTTRDLIFLGIGLVCIVMFIVLACLAQSNWSLAANDVLACGKIFTNADAESVATKEAYLSEIHSSHVAYVVLTALALVIACVALFFFVFTFARLEKARKSRKLTLVFVTLAIFFVVGFFYCFACVKTLSTDYSELGTQLQTSAAKASAELTSFYTGQRNIVLKVYTAYSVVTYFLSICAIVAVGLGLKLVDGAKEKEEEAANLHTFVESEGDSALQ